MRALHELGLQHEVAIVGFDDVMLGDVVDPGITVVAAGPLRARPPGRRSCCSRGSTGYDGPTRQVVIPTQLIERGSGERPPRGGG